MNMESLQVLRKGNGWFITPIALTLSGALGMGINGYLVSHFVSLSQYFTYHPPWTNLNTIDAIVFGGGVGLALGGSLVMPRAWLAFLLSPVFAFLAITGAAACICLIVGYPISKIATLFESRSILALMVLFVPSFVGIQLLFLRRGHLGGFSLLGISVYTLSGAFIGSVWDYFFPELMQNYFPLKHFYGAIFGMIQYFGILAAARMSGSTSKVVYTKVVDGKDTSPP